MKQGLCLKCRASNRFVAECPGQPKTAPDKQKGPSRGLLSHKKVGGTTKKAPKGVTMAETLSDPESPGSDASSSSKEAEQQLSRNGYNLP